MAMKTIIVKIIESYFKDKLGFRKDILLDTLKEAGIPVIISPYHLSLTVKDGTLTHDFDMGTRVLTYTWTGDIAEPTQKRATTVGGIMNEWRQERYELGQLLRKVEPCVAAEIQKYELMESFGCRGDTTKGRLSELIALRIQLDAMINNLPKEKP